MPRGTKRVNILAYRTSAGKFSPGKTSEPAVDDPSYSPSLTQSSSLPSVIVPCVFWRICINCCFLFGKWLPVRIRHPYLGSAQMPKALAVPSSMAGRVVDL